MNNSPTIKTTPAACELCGDPVRVQILEGYRSGAPILRALCMDCADEVYDTRAEGAPTRRERLSVSTLLILAGLVLGMLGVVGDHIGVGEAPGFGFKQEIAAAIGAFLVGLGALLRADVIAVAGTIVFALAACADIVGIAGSSQGFVSQTESVAGVCVLIAGLAVRLAGARKA